MADVFDDYAMANAWDEMFAKPGEPRPAYRSLFATLQPLSVAVLRSRADQLGRVFTDRGVTFAYAGEERPFPLDLIPRILEAAEWDTLTRAVRQRVEALEAFLADVYGAGEVLTDGVVPRRLVHTSAQYHRQAVGIEPANGVRVHVSGVDLIRDEQGEFRVLEDNLRIPSGVSYVIENRRALSQTLPSLFAEARGRRLPGPAARRAAGGRPRRGHRPVRRRPHAGCLQRGVLRARVAGPADGGRAGRGPRPGVQRQPGTDAHDPGRATGARGLPPGR